MVYIARLAIKNIRIRRRTAKSFHQIGKIIAGVRGIIRAFFNRLDRMLLGITVHIANQQKSQGQTAVGSPCTQSTNACAAAVRVRLQLPCPSLLSISLGLISVQAEPFDLR